MNSKYFGLAQMANGGERIGDLAALTGFGENVADAYGAQAKLTAARSGWVLQDLEFNLGSST